MSQYFALATLLGQAKIAAAIANQGSINITAVAVGDGNGAPVTPVVTMTGLVREVWRGAPVSVSRDPASPTQVLVQAIIPASVAPATIRELALYTDDGQCIVVANYPATDLAATSQGAVNTIDVLIPIVVDTAANVTITVNPATLIPLGQLMRAPISGSAGNWRARRRRDGTERRVHQLAQPVRTVDGRDLAASACAD
jgi:phage-related tail fiber protein